MSTPNNNLDTFKILFLIKGILTLCFSLIFVLYAGIGALIGNYADFNTSDAPPINPGDIFLIIGAIGFIISVAMGTLTLIAAKYLKEVRNYNFIMVMAIINGLTGVLGILLAVFTVIELTKPEVKSLFNRNP